MEKRRMEVIMVLITAVLAVPGTVLAQDKYMLNTQAYKGIAFAQIFGNTPNPIPQASASPEGNCPAASSDEQAAISLGAFVELVSANLQQYTPANGDDATLITSINEKLSALEVYLDQTNTVENACLKTWPLRWFFEEDLQNKIFESQTVQATVQTLFQEHFLPLEQMGLTLPWLLVARRATHIEFLDLLYTTRFLQRCARMTYDDFFSIGIDNPLVDDELMELAQRALQVGLFGAFHMYKENPSAVVNFSEFVDGVSPQTSYYCCHRTKRVCQPTTSAQSFCNMCGSYCCIGSTWCP